MTLQDEERVRDIFREQIGYLIASDRFLFNKLSQIMDGQSIQVGQTTGTKIGTAITQKIGFYGVVPVDQPALVNDPGAVGGVYSQAEVQAVANAVVALIDRLQELGLIA
jgi:hypothetical protein